jgi:hypothetical protein
MEKYLQPIWFAMFTDHPKYSYDYEIGQVPVSELVVAPTSAMMVKNEIYRESYHTYSIIDVEVRFGDRAEVVRYVTNDDDNFSLATEQGYIIGDSQEEVVAEMESQLEMLILEYLEWNDRDRFRWYVDCLEQINPEQAREYVNKHPELFV